MDKEQINQSSRHEAKSSTGGRLKALKEKILNRWVAEGLSLIHVAQSSERLALLDSAPELLEDLIDALEKKGEAAAHKAYGAQELKKQLAKSKFTNFSAIVDEYSLLRRTIFACLKEESPLPKEDFELIQELIDHAISAAAHTYETVNSKRESEESRSAQYAEARYRDIFEGIKDHAIIRTDAQGRVIEWNPGAERIFQYTKREITGRPASVIFTPEDLATRADLHEMKQAREHGCAEDNRWHVKKDGTRFYAVGVMNPFFAANGELAGYIKVLRDNTSEKLLQEKLLDHQARLREAGAQAENARRELHDLIMQAPIPLVALSGPEHRFVIANPPYEELVGRKVAGKTVAEAFPLDEAALFKPLLDGVFRTGVAYVGHDLPFVPGNGPNEGETFYLDLGYYPVRDSSGKVSGLLAVVYDVTEKVKARKSLEDRERQLKLIIDAQASLISYIDSEYRYLTVNKSYEDWFHIPSSDVLGKTVAEVTGAEPFEQIRPLLEKAFAGQEICFEKLIHYPDRPRYIRADYTPDIDSSGSVKGVFATVADITEEKEAEREIRESESRFRMLANGLPQITWTATPDGTVDWYNDWFYGYTGVSRGTTWDDSRAQPMHPDDVERTKAVWYDTVAAGLPFEMEQRFKRGRDGQYRWHLVRGIPILDQQGRVVKYVGANTDIHDQKTIMADLLKERALRERFTNTLTHDLRNPLTAVRLSAQLLARGINNEAQRTKHANRILSSIERAERMITDLLDANRIKGGESIPMKMDQCDIVAIAKHCIDEFEIGHGERFRLVGDTECRGFWSCEGIRRVLDNLIGNALKYGAADQPITLEIHRTATGAKFSVHNRGNELSPEDARDLFTMFRRTKSAEASSTQGWGIGLTLVKGLVEAHGGKVAVSSGEGKGTTFTVELPSDSRAPAMDGEGSR